MANQPKYPRDLPIELTSLDDDAWLVADALYNGSPTVGKVRGSTLKTDLKGADGINAIATTTGANPNTPIIGNSDTYTVSSTDGLIAQHHYGFAGVTGTFLAIAIPSPTTITLQNVDAQEGIAIPTETKLAPVGKKGETGGGGSGGNIIFWEGDNIYGYTPAAINELIVNMIDYRIYYSYGTNQGNVQLLPEIFNQFRDSETIKTNPVPSGIDEMKFDIKKSGLYEMLKTIVIGNVTYDDASMTITIP